MTHAYAMMHAMHWLAVGEHTIPAGDAWLAPAEAARASGMRFTKRRTEYRLRRLAGKRAVAAALGRSVEETGLAAIQLLNRPGGAPYVVVEGVQAPLDVSLTDRAGWAVCLLGSPGEFAAGTLGVDLEVVEPRSPAFVADYFTPREQAYVAAAGGVGQVDGHVAANLIWSAKEAALKVLRVGLRADTRIVDVVVDPQVRPDGWAPLLMRVATGDVFPGWWRRDGHYLLTIATRHTVAPPALLPGGDDLAAAVPVHSWLVNPLAD